MSFLTWYEQVNLWHSDIRINHGWKEGVGSTPIQDIQAQHIRLNSATFCAELC